MGRNFGSLLILSGTLLGIVCSSSAHADYLNEWIATTCDSGADLAAVRFGYADDEDPPFFTRGDPSLDHGLTAEAPTNASQREASCALPSGREVKVRLGTGYYDQGDQYSIWIDKIRVLHGDIDTEGDKGGFPFAVFVYPTGFQVCRFQPGPHGPYVITSGRWNVPPPEIRCDTAVSPIQGPPDLIEYSLSKSVEPRVGSIVVSGKQAGLCQKMVAKVADTQRRTSDLGNSGNPDNDVVAGVRLGTVISTHYFSQIPGFKTAGDSVSSARVQVLDIFGDNQPLPVYVFGRLRNREGYMEEFLVVPPLGVTSEDVMSVANGMQFYDIEQRAQSRGWRVFSGQQTPFAGPKLKILQTSQEIHLLWSSDDMAVLVRPVSTGAVETECSFAEVHPHF